MRILQLDIGGQKVEFHPYVSVLRGLDDGLHEQLLAALSSVSAGRSTVGGLVEAHGVLLDLSDETLRLLDLPATSSNGFDIVVRREELPERAIPSGAGSRSRLDRLRREASVRVTRAQADLDRANAALTASHAALEKRAVDLDAPRAELARLTQRRTDVEEALHAARAAHAEAQEAQARAEERLEPARALRAEAARECAAAAQALEAARAMRDPFASTAVKTARERLAILEGAERQRAQHERDRRGSTGGAVAYVDDEFDDPVVAVEVLESRGLELEASLLALDTVDPFPVETALRELRTANAEGELVPSEEAVALADELERAGGPVADASTAELISGSAMAAVRKRLDAARAALFEAERAMRAPEVSPADAELLENAHEEVLLAQDRADKRFASSRAKDRLEETRRAEQEILDRLGFRSYTDFVLGTSVTGVDPERQERLEVARAELESAERDVAELEAGVDAELARAALLSYQRALQAQAVELLGRDPGDDVIWALRHHRVRVFDTTKRADRLKEALESAGVMIGDEEIPQSLLIDIARIWLEEQSQTAERREQLFHKLADVEARASVAREILRLQRGTDEADQGEEVERERSARRRLHVDDATAAVLAAEQRLAAQDDIEATLAARRAELDSATQKDAAIAAALAEAEAQAAEAAETEQAAARLRARREADLLLAESAEQQAADTIGALSERLTLAAETGEAELQRAVAGAQTEVDEAVAALAAATDALAAIEAQPAEDDDDGLVPSDAAVSAARVEELEWYLLSRVAAQRSVSYAGSVPLVLDDTLADVGGDDLVHLLSRLERMSTAVQVIVLSDDDAIATWAESVGPDRAMALSPGSG